MADDEIHRAEDIGKSKDGKLEPRQIAAIALAVLIVLFAVLNLEEVGVDFAIDKVRMPLILVIAVCGGIGFGIGWLIRGRRDKRDD